MIIHDLKENQINKIKFKKDDYVLDANRCKNYCIGCFSCWIKHPTKCIYNDDFNNMVGILKDADSLIIISRSRYGTYSTPIKKVLERLIGYVLPYFTIRDGMIHHETRYTKKLNFNCYFYGDIKKEEENNLLNIVKANSINLNANYKVNFLNNYKEIKKCIL